MIGPDEQLSLAYAPARLRPYYAALLGFDAALGQAFKATNEVGLIQIRLAWWRDQLEKSNAREPMITALHDMMHNHDVKVETLIKIIEGWAVLLDDPPYDDATLLEYAQQRGAGVFAVAAELARCTVDDQAGIGWALTDFARHCSDVETAKRAMAMACEALDGTVVVALPKPMRSFAVLTRFAQSDCQRPLNAQRVAGSPYRIIQAIGFKLFRR
jgi:phytoene synthase